jgi:hypothetical protein
LHDRRLSLGRALGRHQRTSRLDRSTRFFDAQTQRRRDEPPWLRHWFNRRRRFLDARRFWGGLRLRDLRRRRLNNDSNRRSGRLSGYSRSRNDRLFDLLFGDRRYRFRRFDRRRRWCRRRCLRPDRLDEARRTQNGRRRFWRLRLFDCGRLLPALRRRRHVGEHVAARKRDVTLPGNTFDERTCDHFLDGARRALQLDAVIALEQREDFLAR